MTAGAVVFVSEATATAWVQEAAERGVREGYQAGWRAGWDARGREDEHAFGRLSDERNKLARLLADRVPRRLYEAARAESDAVERAHERVRREAARLRGRLRAARGMVAALDEHADAIARDRDAWREAATTLGEEAAALRAAGGRLLELLDGPLNGSTARETLAAMSSLASLAARP